MSKVHFVFHSCGPQECDCNPMCHVWVNKAKVSGFVKNVTCKNCLRIIAAMGKRRNISSPENNNEQ